MVIGRQTPCVGRVPQGAGDGWDGMPLERGQAGALCNTVPCVDYGSCRDGNAVWPTNVPSATVGQRRLLATTATHLVTGDAHAA